MSPALRAARNGAIAALVILVVAGVGGWLYASRTGALSRIDSLDRVALVFASHGEDGTQLAQVVALVTRDGSSIDFIDPGTKAVIPGTSFSKIRDAYAFGGGKGVAAALEKRAGGPVAYVDVPEDSWEAALAQAGGVTVSLPQSMEVFDGTTLASFSEGTSTVPASHVPLLMQGLTYMGVEQQRRDIAQAVAKASVEAFAGWKGAPSVATDLSDEAFARLMGRLGGR